MFRGASCAAQVETSSHLLHTIGKYINGPTASLISGAVDQALTSPSRLLISGLRSSSAKAKARIPPEGGS